MVFVQIGLLLVGEKEVAGRLGIMILGIQEVLVSFHTEFQHESLIY